MKSRFPILPTFILKYPLENNLYLSKVKSPIFIFHGEKDYVIAPENSLQLKPLLKDKDTIFLLKNQGHIGINDHSQYQKELIAILK